MNSFLQKECDLNFFHENGFFRKQCASCGDFFWAVDSSATVCGDYPCVKFLFINNPLGKKSLSLSEVRNSFLSYFLNHGHKKILYPETGDRCPVVARWRTDIYLTIASIADFQPHITSGEVPPPENPLVVSQPCIRLNDLENVGISGRHLTMFEMMGHHAFNKNDDEIYFKEDTIRFCDDYFVNHIGIKQDYITYKEQLWHGGGNAGPCLEVLAGGLEIATLVFMNMREDEKGTFEINGKRYMKNPLNIVDTGYGLERISWCTQGTSTIYETVFPKIISLITNNAKNKHDVASTYALSDHTKCLTFMLGDGIVPSNVKAGYLARLIIRRSLRFIEKLGLDLSLKSLVLKHLDLLCTEFSSLKRRKHQIEEILEIESTRFQDTLSKGKTLVKNIITEKETIDTSDLIKLYDTHGMPPDIVKNIANQLDKEVYIPENFDSMIAELHSHEKKDETIEEENIKLPKTEMLYYLNHYTQEFDATVLWIKQKGNKSKVVLDKTAFYPEGGGQPTDLGTLIYNRRKIKVLNVEKQGNAIVHSIDGILSIGDKIHGRIDWDRRYTLMKHHTGTHVVNGALKEIYGNHIWQAGSQLGLSEARFDFSHYKSIRNDEIPQIEKLANEFIRQEIQVEKKVMARNDAERIYGFRLYQGGVPKGNQIRVLNIPGIDVEACGGTHLNNIKEIEKIRILKVERIQDGVNRLVFAAGKMVDEYERREEQLYNNILTLLASKYQIINREDVSEQLQETMKIFSVSIDQLEKTLQRFLKETSIKEKKQASTLSEAANNLFSEWKKFQKKKKTILKDDIEELKRNATSIPGTSIKIITAITESESVTLAGALIKYSDYVVHIYDGKKITSAASENIDIDLRKEIAPEIGKILGGSGGGKPKLTQSGGPNHNNVKDALNKAKKMTIEFLKQV